MTTDEGAKNNKESPAAAVAAQGEDVTSNKDRGVLKVRPRGRMTWENSLSGKIFCKNLFGGGAGGG